MTESETPQPPQTGIHYFIDKFLKIELTDGRIIVGKLSCTDNAPNMIITHAEEYWKEEEPEPKNIRAVGMVMINGKHIQKVYEIIEPKISKVEMNSDEKQSKV